MSKKTKMIMLCSGIFLLLAASSLGIWLLTKKDEPASKGNVLGVAWYDEDGKEFTIDTAEELRELAALSEHYNFKGQTIKLGADIVDNEGTATDWEFKVPEHVWEPIMNFAGTFDGQGHTISGICGYGFIYTVGHGESTFHTTGLFNNTQTGCVIKDFRLVNSFFYSDFNEGAGSITNRGGGTFDSIYSSATILTYKNCTGGLIGMLDARGSHKVTNCWFDGELRVEGMTGRFIGGIVGQICDTNGQNKIEHCLNTGTLSSTVSGTGVNLGGLVGIVYKSARVSLKDCMSTGDITNEYGIAVGSVIGNIASSSSTNMNDVYTTVESYEKMIGYQKGATVIGLPMGFETDMLTGYGAYQWTSLDFDNYWAVVEEDTPILKYFADNVPSLEGVEKNFDTSWYAKNKDEYVITNAKELYGFTILSRSTDFSGKTVKLGADIVVNEGKATDWAKEAPEYKWVSVGTVDYPFAGTFDGDMHSISGIYLETDATYSGLFSTTTEVAAIKNLKLLNSYFKFDGASSGGISGRGRGTFDTIYSNAIVIGSKVNLGGMVGQVPGDGGIVMNNCWFDGSVTHTGNTTSDKKSGGLVGVIYSNSVISNCLNTGTIDTTAYTAQNKNSTIVSPIAGGVIGHVAKDKTLTMKGCLNVGDVKVSSAATAAYGSLVGYVDGSIGLTDSYATKESCGAHTLRKCITGNVVVLDKANMKGYQAYQRTLLDFDKYWAVVKNDTPVLKSFATSVPSLTGVKRLYDIKWYNADKKTYVLDSKEDLYGFALLSNNTNFDGKTIKLGADIVFNSGNAAEWAKKVPTYKWLPISSNLVPFKGTFDGCMHSISGIYLNTTEMYNGLFAATAKEATIKNLKLTNSYFESSALSFGSIAGRGRGTFDTIYSDAIVVTSKGNVGGMIGQVPGDGGIKMTNCWFDGSVTNTGNTFDDRRTGGLVGVLYSDSIVSNCLNSGDVDVTKYTLENKPGNKVVVPLAGGLVGYWSKSVLTIEGCLNVGNVLVSDKASIGYGPVIGYRDAELTLKDTYATTESCKSFTTSRINGLVSKVEANMISGVGAYQWTLLDFDKYWAAVTGTPILKSFTGEMLSLAGLDRMIDFSWYEQAKGTAEDPYILSHAADLYGFAQLSKESNFAGKTIKLDRDIVVNKDMSNPQYTWTQIGSSSKEFAGTFDGQMHSISGLYLKTNERFCGLFATAGNTSIIKNLSLKDSYFETTGGDCGSIVGRGRGSLDTVYSNATVISSNARVGGLVGQVYDENVVFNNCWFDGQLTATGNTKTNRGTGGIIGMFAGTNCSMTNCLNTGIIDATAYTCKNSATSTLVAPLVGGLIGQVYPDNSIIIKDCLNSGEIKISNAAKEGTTGYGSIIGYSEGIATVSDTYATLESCKVASGGSAKGVVGRISQVAADSIKGYNGYQWTVLDFEKYWAVVKNPKDDIPILKSFASEVPSLANVEKMIDFSWVEQAKGTEADPYILMDAADLYGLATLSAVNDFAGKYIKLGTDIVVNRGNANEWKDEVPSYNWTPIGTQDNPFAGTFDGEDPVTPGVIHGISGIYLNTTSRFAGLFSFTADTAKIQNLKLKNSYMKTTAADFGSIAGVGDGQFNTIYSEAIIDCSNSRIGGLIGQNAGTDVKMTNCWYSGTITNSAVKAQGTGGLVGVIANGTKLTMQSGYFSGVVDTTACTEQAPYAGGWVGIVGMGGTSASGELILKDSLITGSIYQNPTNTKGCAAWVGIVNKNAKLTYETQSYSVKEACNRSLNAGENAQLITTVPAPAQRGITTILGTAAQTQMPRLSWGSAWETVHGTTPVLKAFKDEVIDTSWIDKAQGTESDPYILSDRADLYGLAMLSQNATYNNFTGKFIKLGADIVVNVGDADTWANGGPGLVWNSIGANGTPFNGTFNGDMHSISGIYINTTSRWFGLFGVTGSDSVIKNLKITNSYMKTTVADFGGIAGVGGGEFNTIYNEAIIDCAAARSGGFLGQASGADVKLIKCQFAGSIANSAVKAQGTGGFVGVIVNGTKLTMQSCYHSGVVDASACNQCEPWAGGLVGQVGQGASGELIVRDSLITGAVIANATYTKGYGAAFGYAHNKSTTTYEGNSNYFTQESCNRTMTASTTATINGTAPAKRVETNILGAGAQTLMPNLSWESVWITVTEPEDGLPVLKTFIDMKK